MDYPGVLRELGEPIEIHVLRSRCGYLDKTEVGYQEACVLKNLRSVLEARFQGHIPGDRLPLPELRRNVSFAAPSERSLISSLDVLACKFVSRPRYAAKAASISPHSD